MLVAATVILAARTIYENSHPLILHGGNAKVVAIPATGRDIRSPVSHLFGRAPFFIICDRSRKTYKVVPNGYVDAQHAAGLRAGRMIAGMGVDAVCADNIGFEPAKVLTAANIEMYTGINGTAWETLRDFPAALTRIEGQNVPPHFGITGSKKPIACTSFDATANMERILQGRFFICFDCGYRLPGESRPQDGSSSCPRCGKNIHEVICVTSPGGPGAIKPKIGVF